MMTSPDDGSLDIGDLNSPLGLGFGRTLRDMRFMGMTLQIYGFFCCLTLVGAAVGVPMILVARRFLRGINNFDDYRTNNDMDTLKMGFDELGRSFRLMKIMTIVSVVLGVLYLLFVLLIGGIGLMNGLGN